MNSFNYYLFDLDGTLIDTKEMIYLCFSKTLMDYRGMKIPKSEVDRYVGLPYRIQLEKYLGKISDVEYLKMRDEHKVFQDSIYKEHIKPCLGAVETVLELKKRGFPLAIVTSRNPDSTTNYLRQFGLRDSFSHLITPLDTNLHKPNPEPVLKALELLGASANESIFIGDSIYDIESGKRAGVKTAYTSWANANFTDLKYKPDFIVSDLRELL